MRNPEELRGFPAPVGGEFATYWTGCRCTPIIPRTRRALTCSQGAANQPPFQASHRLAARSRSWPDYDGPSSRAPSPLKVFRLPGPGRPRRIDEQARRDRASHQADDGVMLEGEQQLVHETSASPRLSLPRRGGWPPEAPGGVAFSSRRRRWIAAHQADCDQDRCSRIEEPETLGREFASR